MSVELYDAIFSGGNADIRKMIVISLILKARFIVSSASGGELLTCRKILAVNSYKSPVAQVAISILATSGNIGFNSTMQDINTQLNTDWLSIVAAISE